VCNGVDNCPVEPNADQASVNGVGVACQMQAITVPANPANPAVPHVTYSGASITLKGIARYGGDQFKWDFGDGSTSTDWTSITDRYALGVKHAYTGLVGQLFVATLSVHNSANPSVVATADYLVKIVQSSSIASVPSDPNQLDVRATMAIDEGLWRLHVAEGRGEYVDGAPGYNQPYGSWEGDTATSCVALDAFEVHGSTPEQSWRSDPYVEDARRGLTYLLANAQAGTIGQQVAGNPDFNGNGIGVHIGGRAAYVEGVCAIALADSGSPDRRAQAGPTGVYSESYKDIAQDTVDWFAWGQVEANGNGFGRGGWGYTATDQTSTNESLRWPILAMRAAEREMSATVPAFVRTELASYILRSQYRGLDSNNGGWGDFGTSDLMDVGFAASGLIAYEFVGNIVANPAPNVQAGLGFIYRHWTDNNGLWDANLGDSDAMYGVMQAMQNATPSILQIKNFDYTTGQQSANGFDWYHTPAGQTQEGVATNLVRRQASDGSWSDDSLGNAAGEKRGSLWSTAWATIILNKEARPGAPVAPVADAGGPYSGEKNTPIALDASASFSSDGGPLTYSWDINGDGVFGDATGPTAVFHGSQDTNLADGTSTGVSYSVCVLVTDSHGGESTACAPVTVKPSLDSPPYASAGGPYTGAVGVPVQLDASASYDVDGDQLTYAWDLNNNGAFVDATGPNPTVTFAQPGSYAIGVKVTDSHGLSDTAFTTVTIGDHAPQASAGGPYSGRPGSPVTLDASGSSDPDGDPITYAWDLQSNGGFADSTQAKPTFTVPSSAIPGTALQVCVKVTDSFGRYDTACSSVTVVAPTVPPEVPTGLAAVASDGSVLLSWAAPTGATTYEVFRSADGGSSYVSLGSASTPSFVDSTVDRGARYDYAVSASNAGGASARSASSSVTLPPAPLDEPDRDRNGRFGRACLDGLGRRYQLRGFPVIRRRRLRRRSGSSFDAVVWRFGGRAGRDVPLCRVGDERRRRLRSLRACVGHTPVAAALVDCSARRAGDRGTDGRRRGCRGARRNRRDFRRRSGRRHLDGRRGRCVRWLRDARLRPALPVGRAVAGHRRQPRVAHGNRRRGSGRAEARRSRIGRRDVARPGRPRSARSDSRHPRRHRPRRVECRRHRRRLPRDVESDLRFPRPARTADSVGRDQRAVVTCARPRRSRRAVAYVAYRRLLGRRVERRRRRPRCAGCDHLLRRRRRTAGHAHGRERRDVRRHPLARVRQARDQHLAVGYR